jgi:TonB family protein
MDRTGYTYNSLHTMRHELVSDVVRKRILIFVITGHTLLLVVPGVWYLISNWLIPDPPKVFKVKLVSPPPSSSDASAFPPPAKKSETPPPKTPPKKTPPKKKTVKKAPPKKKWKAVKSSDIKVTKKVVKNKSTPAKKYTPSPIKKVSSEDIAKNLRKFQPQVSVANTGNTSASDMDYFESVSAYLYRMWRQPAKAELGGRRPTVTVKVKVSASGSITFSKISRKSGVSAMDNSVQSLLRSVSRLPSPGKEMEFDILLEIADN